MKMLIENIRLAFSSLLANKSRALLTMLGIIIGIASVIGIMTVGNSLNMSVSSSMQTMGANNITVSVSQRENEAEERKNGIVFGSKKISRDMTSDDCLTDEMIYSLLEEYPDEIEAVSTSESLGGGVVKKGTEDVDLTVTGVSLGYFSANDIEMLYGNIIKQEELIGAKNVVLVSDELCKDLFDKSSSDLLGKEILVNIDNQNVIYTITGIYKYQETALSSGGSTCYIPLTTAQNFNHSKNYSTFSVVTKVGVDSEEFADKIQNYLNGYYRNNKFFEISTTSMSSMASTLSDMLGTITTAIAIIAGIALLVGGIGVMNIMLVSITERTKEIGTRKALGASNGNIRMQFIIEAMIICLIGGLIGIILGIIIGMLGSSILGFSASPSVSSILISLAFSLGIGLFFGYRPANKAAKMNPIDALRYE